MTQKYRDMPDEATIIKAFNDTRGLVSVSARTLGVSIRWLYYKLEESEELRTSLTEARNMQTDIVEAALFRKIDRGDIAAIIFYLKTRARERGYVERQEFDVAGHMVTESAGPTAGEIVQELMHSDDFVDFCRKREADRVAGLLCDEREHAAGPDNGEAATESEAKVDPSPPSDANGSGGNGRPKG